MKVRFIKAWDPYQVGEILDLPDAFLEGNQMFTRGIVVKHGQDKEPAVKQVEAPSANKMQNRAKTK